MKFKYRSSRILALAVALATGAMLALGAWAPCSGRTALPRPVAAEVLQAVQYPRDVLLIRHAEKPDDTSDKHLTSRGAARAAALPSLFFIPKAFRTRPAPFPTPDFIYATAESKHSNRPVETVQPLASALGDATIHAEHEDDDFQPVVDHLFNQKHAGKTALVCWHHGQMRHLALAVAAKAKNADQVRKKIPKWDDDVYDRVWHFTFTEQGEATFADRPQRLLFKDSPD
jgi:hypothetical protein